MQPAGSNEPAVELVGREALVHLLALLKAKEMTALDMQDLEPFHVFGWLLDAAEHEVVKDITAK
eukprot:8351600-Heterocapsa_arctica.AAC.1